MPSTFGLDHLEQTCPVVPAVSGGGRRVVQVLDRVRQPSPNPGFDTGLDDVVGGGAHHRHSTQLPRVTAPDEIGGQLCARPDDRRDQLHMFVQVRESILDRAADRLDQCGRMEHARQRGQEDVEVCQIEELGQSYVGAEESGRSQNPQDGFPAAKGVRIPAVIGIGSVGAEHGCGHHDPARDEVAAPTGHPVGRRRGAFRGIGAEVDDGPAGQILDRVENVVHRLIVGQAEDDQLRCRDRCGRLGCSRRSCFDQSIGARRCPVPDGDGVAGSQQYASHRLPHRPEADDGERSGGHRHEKVPSGVGCAMDSTMRAKLSVPWPESRSAAINLCTIAMGWTPASANSIPLPGVRFQTTTERSALSSADARARPISPRPRMLTVTGVFMT